MPIYNQLLNVSGRLPIEFALLRNLNVIANHNVKFPRSVTKITWDFIRNFVWNSEEKVHKFHKKYNNKLSTINSG